MIPTSANEYASSLNAYGTGDFWLELLHSSPIEIMMVLLCGVVLIIGILIVFILIMYIIQWVIEIRKEHKQNKELRK